MVSYNYLGYGVTNSEGIAKLDHDATGEPISHSYTGVGAGEIDVLASLDNPISSGSIVSETLSVIDATVMDRGLSGSGNHNDSMWSSVTGFTRESDGTSVSITQQTYTDKIDVGYCVELDLISTENYCRTNIGKYQDGQSTTYHGYVYNTPCHITIRVTPTQIVFKKDGTDVLTINDTKNQFRFFFVVDSGTSQSDFKFKNLCIYPI